MARIEGYETDPLQVSLAVDPVHFGLDLCPTKELTPNLKASQGDGDHESDYAKPIHE
jgi:hypothetical protein